MNKKYNGKLEHLPYDFLDKAKNVSDNVNYQLAKINRMFEYKNFPEEIPRDLYERNLMCATFSGIKKIGDKLYAFQGGIGGEPNPYYFPTKFIVANPALNLSKEYEIDKDIVLIKNDSMMIGLLPHLLKNCTLLAENELSMLLASIFCRMQTLISAQDDNTKAAGDLFIQQLIAGKPSVIGDTILESLKTQPFANQTNGITDLIELEQYIKASMNNDLGLSTNYNMKRESINSTEANLGSDALQPFVLDMLKCRQEGWEKVNKMYGTNVTVQLAEPWASAFAVNSEGGEENEDTEGDLPDNDAERDSALVDE